MVILNNGDQWSSIIVELLLAKSPHGEPSQVAEQQADLPLLPHHLPDHRYHPGILHRWMQKSNWVYFQLKHIVTVIHSTGRSQPSLARSRERSGRHQSPPRLCQVAKNHKSRLGINHITISQHSQRNQPILFYKEAVQHQIKLLSQTLLVLH